MFSHMFLLSLFFYFLLYCTGYPPLPLSCSTDVFLGKVRFLNHGKDRGQVLHRVDFQQTLFTKAMYSSYSSPLFDCISVKRSIIFTNHHSQILTIHNNFQVFIQIDLTLTLSISLTPFGM